jgi:hypothetical protein
LRLALQLVGERRSVRIDRQPNPCAGVNHRALCRSKPLDDICDCRIEVRGLVRDAILAASYACSSSGSIVRLAVRRQSSHTGPGDLKVRGAERVQMVTDRERSELRTAYFVMPCTHRNDVDLLIAQLAQRQAGTTNERLPFYLPETTIIAMSRRARHTTPVIAFVAPGPVVTFTRPICC